MCNFHFFSGIPRISPPLPECLSPRLLEDLALKQQGNVRERTGLVQGSNKPEVLIKLSQIGLNSSGQLGRIIFCTIHTTGNHQQYKRLSHFQIVDISFPQAAKLLCTNPCKKQALLDPGAGMSYFYLWRVISWISEWLLAVGQGHLRTASLPSLLWSIPPEKMQRRQGKGFISDWDYFRHHTHDIPPQFGLSQKPKTQN